MRIRLLRRAIRKLILENKQAFQKELLGHPDWDEGEDDTIMVDDEWWMSQNDIPQRSRTRGRPLKQIWAKHVNRKWVQSLTYVHWTSEHLIWDMVDESQPSASKDEISCNAYLDRSDITINKHYGPVSYTHLRAHET